MSRTSILSFSFTLKILLPPRVGIPLEAAEMVFVDKTGRGDAGASGTGPQLLHFLFAQSVINLLKLVVLGFAHNLAALQIGPVTLVLRVAHPAAIANLKIVSPTKPLVQRGRREAAAVFGFGPRTDTRMTPARPARLRGLKPQNAVSFGLNLPA